MAGGEFRCAFFARDYEATIAFYRDGLGLPIVEAWDHGPEDQGTLLGAASGLIEVLRLPPNQQTDSAWYHSGPQGVMIVIEAEDVDTWYGRVLSKGLVIVEGLTDQEWGHRSFRVSDPNGMTIYIFSKSA